MNVHACVLHSGARRASLAGVPKRVRCRAVPCVRVSEQLILVQLCFDPFQAMKLWYMSEQEDHDIWH